MTHDLIQRPGTALTATQFQQLAELPPETTWFANITNPQTRRAYRTDLNDFMRFIGIERPEQFRAVTRAHVMAWRDDLDARALSRATVRRKLAALSSLFNSLCGDNALALNPTDGVRRPKVQRNEGKTPAIGDHEARALLNAPDPATLRGQRDRAILSVLLYHGLRRAELCRLKVADLQMRRGVLELCVWGKGDKERSIPVHPATAQSIDAYLERAGHRADLQGSLFRPIRNHVHDNTRASITPDGVYKMLLAYAKTVQIQVQGFGPHALRATAATNALENEADIAKVQEWLGHANISTTRIYDRRKMRPEDSPTFKVRY